MTNFLSFDIFFKDLFQQKSIFTRVTKKKVKSRFKHVLPDIFKKYFKHNYNITIETVLTIKKTVDNLFGVNPFFGPNLTILIQDANKILQIKPFIA
jgi:hypothetical protein